MEAGDGRGTGRVILDVRNPAAWTLDAYRVLVALAFNGDWPVPARVAIEELEARTGDPNIRIFVGREGQSLKALAILILPVSGFFTAAGLWHFYNRGSSALRRDLCAAVVEATRSAGYSAIQTVNVNGRDRAFERLARDLGTPVRIGTLYRFDLGEGPCRSSETFCSGASPSPAGS